MRALVICLIIAVATAAQYSQAQQKSMPPASGLNKSPYLGLRYGGDKLPRGHKWIGGSLLSDPYRDEKQYGVTEVAKGRVRMMWFDFLTHHDAAGHAHWVIKDVLFLPVIRKTQLLFYVDCMLADKPDPELIVIVDTVSREGVYTRVRQAWRANRQTEKFERISVKGIKCVAQGDD